MKELKKEFEKKNPETELLLEASGSRTAARKVSDLKRPVDIAASADYMVINNLLMPEYADFNIHFATNEMALVYSPESKHKYKINKNNWYKILLREEVQYGHSDPQKDPCGYRTQLVWQLAEKYYNQQGLYAKLKKGISKKNIRPKETDLLALLETGALDYIFLYRSVAVQHALPFIKLPDKINLKNAQYDDYYKSASIQLTGKKPGDKVTVKGQSMVYGVTMVKDPQNRAGALKFLKFMLSDKGLAIIQKLGQNPIQPPLVKEYGKLPQELKPLVQNTP